VKFRSIHRIVFAAAALSALLVVPAAAQMSGREQAFVQGLQKRGLLRLLEQYLEDMETAGGDALAIKEQQAGLFEMQGLRAPTEQQRADLFAKAKKKHQELIAELQKKADQETDARAKDQLRLRVLELKIRMGELIWMREPFDQLNILELTDKELGDRDRVTRLMREATDVFESVVAEAQAWADGMASDPEYERRFLNTGIYDKVAIYSEFAKYRTAWTEYYLAYVLKDGSYDVVLTAAGDKGPEVVKVLVQVAGLTEDQAADAAGHTPRRVAHGLPQDKAEALKARLVEAGANADMVRQRDNLLEDAVKKFTEFSQYQDSNEKWQSLRLLGMCLREQGLYAKAVEKLREALEGSKDESFKVQVYYELVQTALAARKYDDARAFLEELRSKNFPSLAQSFIGQHLMPFLDAKIAFAEGVAQPEKKARGLKLMKELWDRAPSLRILISPEVLKHIDRSDITKLKPFELWILADETFTAGKYEEAAKYFEQYLRITPTDDPTHQEAMFNLAACYYKLAEAEDATAERRYEMMNKAAERFFEVASRFAGFHSVGRAAESYVLLRSEIYEDHPTDENLEKYAQALRWSLEHRTRAAEAADMRWLYGRALQVQKKYVEAAQQYEKVNPQDSPNYYEARYRAAVCYRLDLLENKWMTASNEALPRLAGEAVGKMEAYTEWAIAEAAKATGDPKVAGQLRGNAAQMLVWAAEILAQERVQQYERGLKLLERCEKEFPEQLKQMLGAILKVKIDCYFAQGRLDEVEKILDKLMTTAEDVGPILDRLFSDTTADIDRLIRQDRKAEVRQRILPRADQIGSKFINYLDKQGKPPEDIRSIEYQLAELHMRAEDFEGEKGAIKRFLGLIGFDPYEPDQREAFLSGEKAVDVTYLAGLAKCTQQVVQVKGDTGQTMIQQEAGKAYDYLKRSEFYWSNVADGYDKPIKGMDMKEQQLIWWDAKYNQMQVMLDLHPLEQRFAEKDKAIDYQGRAKSFIENYRASGSSFGDSALRVRFGRLAAQLGIPWP